MKKKLVGLVLAVSLMVPVSANAFFLKSMVEGMTSVSNNMVDGATEVSVQMLELFEALADDIGEMADRILDMADKIGEMADRIVATEQLMADMMVELSAIRNAQGSGSATCTAATDTVFISQDDYQTTLYNGEAPRFQISDGSSQYLLYVSSSAIMNTDTTAVLVKSSYDLDTRWKDLQALANNYKIYVAVKSINGNEISSLSNVIEYRTTY